MLVIVLALFFDFTNGFHDYRQCDGDAIATEEQLKPKVAVLIAALPEPGRAFLSTEVIQTISTGLIRKDQISPDAFLPLIFAGLIGAITWNMLTWLLGLPSSSSHALFGGLIAQRWWVSAPWRSTQRGAQQGHPAGVHRPVHRGCHRCSRRRDLAYAIARQATTPSRTAADGFRWGSDLHVVARRAGARHQRRAEDDGRHHARAHHRRMAEPRAGRPVRLGDLRVRDHHRPGYLHGRLAHHPHPSARGSPTSSLAQGFSARDIRPPRRSSPPAPSALALSTTQVASDR